MKHFIIPTLISMPAAGFAHGSHAPLVEPLHSTFHVTPAIGLLVIAVAVALGLARRPRS